MTVGFNTTQGPTTAPAETDTSKTTKHPRNFLFAFLAAENKDQNTLNFQQIADANSTSMDANIESQVYQAENSLLQTAAAAVSAAATGSDPSNDVPAANSIYQTDSAAAQGVESVQNNMTQTQQQASGQDSTNLQNLTQLTSTLTSVLSTIASLVGHAYT